MSAHFDHELDPIVAKSMETLRVEVARDPQKAAVGRLEYLAQVKILVEDKKASLPVSRMPLFGLNGWIDKIKKTWTKKEHRNMLATIGTWIVIVIMLFGGSGATALAAQDSLPPDFLYPVKIFGEELHLALSADPQARMELHWRFSERRIDEILDILDKGQPLGEEWAVRWNEQFNQALQAAGELDEPAMIRALEQSRLRLHLQELRVQAIEANRPKDPGGTLERVREQLHQQQRLVESALGDPAAFRRHVGEPQRGADGTRNGPLETPPPDDRGGGSGPGPQSTPTCDDCTPALDGTGPGPGPQHQGGDQPVQPPDGGGRSDEGGSDQGSSGTPPDSSGSGGSGSSNENGGMGEGNCDSCGGGGSPRHP